MLMVVVVVVQYLLGDKIQTELTISHPHPKIRNLKTRNHTEYIPHRVLLVVVVVQYLLGDKIKTELTTHTHTHTNEREQKGANHHSDNYNSIHPPTVHCELGWVPKAHSSTHSQLTNTWAVFVERSVHIGLYVVLEFESVEYKGKSSLLKFIVYTVKCLPPVFPSSSEYSRPCIAY